MSTEAREYPPSEQKLAKLRGAGVFPRTRELFLLSALAGLSFALWRFGAVQGDGLLALFEEQFRRGDLASLGRESGEIWARGQLDLVLRWIVRLLWLPLLAVLMLTLVVGLFQSRFLLLSTFLRFDFGRVVSGLTGWGSHFGDRFKRALSAAAQMVAVLALCYLCSLSLVAAFVGGNTLPQGAASGGNQLLPSDIPFDGQITKGDTKSIAKGIAVQTRMLSLARRQILAAKAHFMSILFSLVGFAALLAIVCRFASVLAFRREHGMSKSELQAELRESEASPEMRGAVRDLRSVE